MKYSDEHLRGALRDLAEDLGHPPSRAEMDQEGPVAANTIYRRFGSWTAALEEAGLESRSSSERYSDAELLEDLEDLAEELGNTPAIVDMREQGPHSVTTYIEHFGSWEDALEAAGLDLNDSEPGPQISEEELLEALRSLAEDLGKAPTEMDMREHGDYSESTYRERFGSWSEALDVVGMEPRRSAGPIPETDLLDEITRVRDELGQMPTARDFKEHGEYSINTYRRRFGSWSAAKQRVREVE